MKIVLKPVCAWLFQLVFRMDNTISCFGVLFAHFATHHFQTQKNRPFPIFPKFWNTGWRAELALKLHSKVGVAIESSSRKFFINAKVSCLSLIEYGQSSNLTNERVFFAVRDKFSAKWKENWIAKKHGKKPKFCQKVDRDRQ